MTELLTGAITGALIGSFLALAAERYQFAANFREWFAFLLFPASHCANCLYPLRWRNMIPVISWLAQRGRCRNCSDSFPLTLLFIELICAMLFTLLCWLLPDGTLQVWIALYTALLLLLADIDRRYMLLPDILTLSLLWLGLLFNSFIGPAGSGHAIMGAAAGYVVFALLAEGWRKFHQVAGLGYGDVKLFAALGAWSGWAALPQIALLAALLGMLGAGVIFVRCKYSDKTFSNPQPFGPYLATAGWIVLMTQLLNRPFLHF